MLAEPGHYDYAPYLDRPKLTWPNGARPRLLGRAQYREFYELAPPANPARSVGGRGPNRTFSTIRQRDYGNRAGVWRMMEVMERFGVRGSVSLNAALCDHFPEIIARCTGLGWECSATASTTRGSSLRHGRGRGARRHSATAAIRSARRAARRSTDGSRRRITDTETTQDLLAGIRHPVHARHGP